MKNLLFILFFLIAYSSFGQSPGNDTSKYIHSYRQYGIWHNRLKGDSVVDIPQDTLFSKDGIARINNKFFVGNGIYWREMTGGSGTVITGGDTITIINNQFCIIHLGDTTCYFLPATAPVDSIWRTPGVDSIKFSIGGRLRSIKDSLGGTTIVNPFPGVDSIVPNATGFCWWVENFARCVNLFEKDTVIYTYPLRVKQKETTGADHDSVDVAGGLEGYQLTSHGSTTPVTWEPPRGATAAVDSIWRTAGQDSIKFSIEGRLRSIKDSSGGGAGTPYTASNGLTLTGNDFKLGGQLSGATVLDLNGNALELSGTGGGDSYFSDGLVYLSTSNANLIGVNLAAGDDISLQRPAGGTLFILPDRIELNNIVTNNPILLGLNNTNGIINPVRIGTTVMGTTPTNILVLDGDTVKSYPYSGGGGGTVTGVTGTTPINSSGGTAPNITIDNAAADGATKGAASFTAADFNATTGNISIDYTNGQAASAGAKGFLTSADWSTFNGKQGTISVTSPITLTGASVGMVNQGTTTTVLHGNASGNPSFGAIVNADITNSTIDLTTKVTGVLPIANGGTGAATTSQNFAFIGPTSGSGAPSFRALVAGDIPSLSGTYLPLAGGIMMGGITLSVGTATAGTFPQKYVAGANLTIPEKGAVEFDGVKLYFTPSINRRTIAFLDTAQTFTAAQTFSSNIISNGGLYAQSGLYSNSTPTSSNLMISGTSSGAGLEASSSQAKYITGGNNIQYRVGLRGATATTATAGTDVFALAIGDNTFTEATSGTSALAGGLYIKTQTFTNGSGVTTDFQNAYIGDKPTGATNNYALNTGLLHMREGVDFAYVAKTATYTATASDHIINCTANTFTVTLPTAVGITGRVYIITNPGGGTITIATTSSQTFTNVTATPTTLTLLTLGASVQVASDGANWIKLN